MTYNKISVAFGALRKVNAPPINYQYDQTQILVINGLDLPEYYRVDFCNEGDASAYSIVGSADGVAIPDALLATGKPIKAYIVLVDNGVSTRYEVTIPVRSRPPANDIEPTPAEQSTIDSLIEAMNTAVEDAETAEQGAKDAQQAIEDMTVSAETLAPGSAATVTKTIIEDVVHLLFGIPRGQQGEKGDPGTKGDTGNGIESITLISAVGLDKTYRISYTNGDHFDYVVKDGAKGDTGNGIASIAKTGTSGKVDTYTITYTNGNTTTFTVTNGTDGEDGISPAVTITTITDGHRVTITDADHPSGQSFDVMDGQDGQNTDAEHVTYDPAETYTAGSVGAGLNDLNANKAPIITDTASGAIASFPDGADGLPVKQLTVAVNPVQDLHGYDSPWPAGGGANKFDGEIESGDINVVNGATRSSSTRERSKNFIPVVPNQQYRAVSASYSNFIVCLYGENKEYVGDYQTYINVNATNPFTIPSNCYYIKFYRDVQTNKNVAINYPSTVTTYSPYSNICPISGWTGAGVYDEAEYDPTAQAKLNITFPSSAGTVYGSSFTINDDGTGNLINDLNGVDLSQLTWTTNYTGSIHKAITADISAAVVTSTTHVIDGIAENYANKGNRGSVGQFSDPDSLDIGFYCVAGSSTTNTTKLRLVIGINDSPSGKIVYRLYNTPTPIALSGLPQIQTLYGTNNIWSDTGDTSVTYRADTKLYLEKLTAPTEDDLVADHAIASGTFFMIGNQLFKATAAIANGAAITIGTNATQLSLADALNLINA